MFSATNLVPALVPLTHNTKHYVKVLVESNWQQKSMINIRAATFVCVGVFTSTLAKCPFSDGFPYIRKKCEKGATRVTIILHFKFVDKWPLNF